MRESHAAATNEERGVPRRAQSLGPTRSLVSPCLPHGLVERCDLSEDRGDNGKSDKAHSHPLVLESNSCNQRSKGEKDAGNDPHGRPHPSLETTRLPRCLAIALVLAAGLPGTGRAGTQAPRRTDAIGP